ncbi:MAG: RsmD family RNA methyltransferase [Brevinematales bacterium]|jgi:16S rRNA (guanine(966)-N(2))-methyltransferase RsmD
MRISSGMFKGLPLEIPGSGIKPTTDKVRLAVMNIIQNMVSGSRFLDLYCGSGAIGIEALSNGAAFACFVEDSKKNYMFLKRNLDAIVQDSTKYRYIKHNVLALGDLFSKSPIESFDIIFADPFYRDAEFHFEELYKIAVDLLKPRGTFILEHGNKNKFSDYPFFTEEKRYGDTSLSIFKKQGQTDL